MHAERVDGATMRLDTKVGHAWLICILAANTAVCSPRMQHTSGIAGIHSANLIVDNAPDVRFCVERWDLLWWFVLVTDRCTLQL